jgi:hypothetical protein
MEAKELKKALRIGNIVYSHRHVGKLTEIGERIKGTSIIDNEDWTFDVTMNLIKPIPLTEKWLLKFGFDNCILRILETEIYLQWCEYERGLYLSTDIGQGKVSDPDTFIEGNFKHVHQLQNLYFALTGEELSCKN